jgi:phage I-like protein
MKFKNRLQKHISLAILSASSFASMPDENVAILSAELKTNANGLVQLLPAGYFNAVDGRPKDVANNQWLMDAQAFDMLKSNTPHQIGDLVIDYEHQTLKAETNGKPAIAAGYFNVNDLVFIEDQGLFIKPRWTDNAQAYLSAGEYKYISAVFGYDRQTGRPSFMHSAGLVNRPGVDGMEPLAQLAAEQHVKSNSISTHQPTHQSTQQEENAVNELLLAILQALGINVEGDLPTETTALKALETQVTTALAALSANSDKVATLNQQIVALQANSHNPDPTQFAPVAALTALQTQVAALQASATSDKVTTVVANGVSSGRIIPALKAWATELGNKDLAQLEAFIDKAAPIAALQGMQTADLSLDEHGHQKTGVAALSAEDKQAADNLGISHEDFAEHKAKEQGAK